LNDSPAANVCTPAASATEVKQSVEDKTRDSANHQYLQEINEIVGYVADDITKLFSL
jgi:hypothetical protein